ncbi:AlpA family transcriptional regulator [Thiomicrospira microaerophila]|uniref:helix-turn-helix transcriptional regulator n=1 Tax=Thiomicrospira microaerophila TaxID=406020 RepID=UPI00200D9C2E|nr:AlpA family transcriptional regulator [Thiomicrospira microaerophila]UQB43140.1 AlpA family transcriptional regulator [Thiomicrospira microaerophila]
MTTLLRAKQTQAATGLSRSHLYNLVSKGLFPKPVKLSEKSVAWIEAEVQAWIDSRIAERDNVEGSK